MPKEGFKNQWIAISQKGKFRDSEGVERDLNDDFLKKAIANFTPNDAPAVIGHPKEHDPAFGWAAAVRLNGDVLEAQFADTDDEFEKMVEKGLFKKRSASFYLDPPKLRHVGFLGAQPPAVKGLRDIQFSDGESVTVEINFSEENQMNLKDEDVEKVTESVFEKLRNYFKKPDAGEKQTAEFSEEAMKKAITDTVGAAVKEAETKLTADFTEKLKAKDDEIKTIRESTEGAAASGKRAEIAQFVESIPAEKGKHFLKNIGVVEFLEACANADAANKNAEFVAFSEGEGDDKKDHKFTLLGWAKNLVEALPPMIEFGEKFGNIKATAAAGEMLDPKKVEDMRAGMGIKSEGGQK